MSIHTLFDPLSNESACRPGAHWIISGAEAHHALHVKRSRVGDSLRLINGAGFEAQCRLERICGKTIDLEITSADQHIAPGAKGGQRRVIIACPPPKGPRAEFLIDQLSQIGIDTWIPLITGRSVADPRQGKIERWRQTVIVESAKQSGRVWLMKISEPVKIKSLWECAAMATPDLRLQSILIADRGGEPIRQVISTISAPGDILGISGPEGGFTEEESASIGVEGGDAVGTVLPVRLGCHILRLETAAAALAAMVVNMTA